MNDAGAVVSTALFFVGVVGALVLIAHRCLSPITPTEAIRITNCGWEMSSREAGRVVHLVPTGDEIAHEEQFGPCSCNPSQRSFALEDGTHGWLYLHHPKMRVPR